MSESNPSTTNVIADKAAESLVKATQSKSDQNDWFEFEEVYIEHLGANTADSTNKLLGRPEDFLILFSKGSHKALAFAKNFKEAEDKKDMSLLRGKIIPDLILCIKEESENYIKAGGDAQIAEQNKKKLIKVFKKAIGSFKEFYERILKIQTMTTFFYRNLNKHTRNGSWGQMQTLLPYAFCLCKAFVYFEENLEVSQIINTNAEDKINSNPVIVYRGVDLEDSEVTFFETRIGKSFSMNSPSAASVERKKAEQFIKKRKKRSVIFEIEIPQKGKGVAYRNYIDVQQFSERSHEKEILFGFGNHFKIKNVRKEGDKTIIRIIQSNDFESFIYAGMIIPGMLFKFMMTEKKMKIPCLTGNELVQMIGYLSGNTLIESIEFCLCRFDENSLEKILDTVSGMSELKKLKFISCTFERKKGDNLQIFQKTDILNIQKIKIIDTNDFYKILEVRNWKSLKEFDITFLKSANITDKEIDDICNQGLTNFKGLTSLKMNFEYSKCITDEGIDILSSKGLANLPGLKNLNLSFAKCSEITDNGMTILCSKGLISLKNLMTLRLNLQECNKITNCHTKLFDFLNLKPFTNMRSLDVSFQECRQITDESINNFCCQILHYLPQLISLRLNLEGCSKVTDKGINILCSEGLKRLSLLRFFSLNFKDCFKLTDKGIEELCSNGLSYSPQLQSLELDFSECEEITDDGIKSLCSKGLQNLPLLTCLSLNFQRCSNITDKGIIHLCSSKLDVLDNLTSLSLNFQKCEKLTDEGLRSLSIERLKKLQKLKSLSLNFSWCEITDHGVEYLSEELQYLIQLTSLDLKLKYCKEIQDKGLNQLFQKAIPALKSLNLLTLHFEGICSITDQVFDELTSGLKPLFVLTFLNLDFAECCEISNNGVSKLCLETSKNLLHLNISFKRCPKVDRQHIFEMKNFKNSNFDHPFKLNCRRSLLASKKSSQNELSQNFTATKFPSSDANANHYLDLKKYISQSNSPKEEEDNLRKSKLLNLDLAGNSEFTCEQIQDLILKEIQFFIELKNLNLSFGNCSEITDKKLEILGSRLVKSLPNLESLILNFEGCSNISDEGIENLCYEGLGALALLKILKINFRKCTKLTHFGVENLCDSGLSGLEKLIHLSLNFAFCSKIRDNAIEILCTGGLKGRSTLKTLSLNLEGCSEISEKSIEIISSLVLVDLTHLSLHFAGCNKINDAAIMVLCFQNLKNRIQLEELDLNFQGCNITDQGIYHLCFQALRRLGNLISFKINFENCPEITDFTKLHIITLLPYFQWIVQSF